MEHAQKHTTHNKGNDKIHENNQDSKNSKKNQDNDFSQDQKSMQLNENKLVQDRLHKLEKIKSLNINPFPYSYDKTHFANELKEKYSSLAPQEKSDEFVSVAGRIMTVRDMGKASFANLRDESGDIQVYVKLDDVGEKSYELFKLLDIGDIIGIKGTIFKTRMGELSVYAKEVVILSKSLYPLPEKFHGITNPEFKYRKRYVDLITSQETKNIFQKRSMIIKSIRDDLSSKGFMEVDTPVLQPIYGGASAAPFVTELNALHTTLYMRISPELYLKRLIVGGYEKVFEIARNFRNEGIDKTHNPEFTMMECYQAYADYNDMMDLAESLIKNACMKVNGSLQVEIEGKSIDLSKFEKISMIDSIKKYANLEVEKLNEQELKNLVRQFALQIKGDLNRGNIINALFEELVEDKLIQPTFIIDYPIEVSPLTKIHRRNDKLTERFELFINGVEYANAYSELSDPIDQKQRLEAQIMARQLGDLEAMPMDEDFIRALEYGMPPTGGLGLGIDRLVILLTMQDTIKDIIFFPFMKPEQNEEKK